MVRAILAGRKTQTRRVIKNSIGWDDNWEVKPCDDSKGFYTMRCGTKYTIPYFKPKYELGDILYVREKFRKLFDCETGKFSHYSYYADMPEDYHKMFPHKWKPSIFIPKEAARIFLQVTDVRAERLHDISNSDAKKEGAPDILRSTSFEAMRGSKFVFPKPFLEFQFGFMALWCKINGVESWDSNPWVWVYTFKTVQNPNL